MEGEKIMRTEVFILLMAAMGLLVLMSGFVTIKRLMICALKKKKAPELLTLPPGNEKYEWVKTAGVTEIYTVLTSDFRQCENSKAVQRFAR